MCSNNKSTENLTQKICSDEHAIDHFEETNIQFIKLHSILVYTETTNIQQNFKTNTPNITNTLITIQDYTHEIFKESAQIEQILKITPKTTNGLEIDTFFQEITLNKTNAFETNESAENFNRKIFSDKHAIEQITEKNFPSIRDLSIEMYMKTVNILENSKKNTPNITNALLTIQNYINEILKETSRMEQILKNTPHTTNAPKSEATNAPKNIMTDRMKAAYASFGKESSEDSPTNNN